MKLHMLSTEDVKTQRLADIKRIAEERHKAKEVDWTKSSFCDAGQCTHCMWQSCSCACHKFDSAPDENEWCGHC